MHKNLSIELEISPELPEWVVGDQQRLRQARHRMSIGGWWGWLRRVLRQRIVVGGWWVAEAGAAPPHDCRWEMGG